MKKSYSISFSIILIFLLVFIFFVAPLTLYSFKNFEKALNQNIENYLKQVSNITQTLFDQESFVLENKAKELSSVLANMSIEEFNDMNIDDDLFSDDVDILFIQSKKEITNLSTSLFDTDSIIEHIISMPSNNSCIQNVLLDSNNISVLLKSKKIIQMGSGKVIGEVFVGKILNENLTFLNNIVQKSNIKDLSFYLNKEIIASSFKHDSTGTKVVDRIDDLLSNRSIYEQQNNIYSKIPLMCENKDTHVSIIPVIDSKVFKSLKDDYRQQIIILLLFFVLVGLITFFLMKRFIIQPMYSLLDYANHIKSSKKSYEHTMIQEYNILANGLESIINELRDVTEQYTLAVEGTQEGLWDWNLKNKSIYFSKRCKEILGFKDEEIDLSLLAWQHRIHPEDREHLDEHLLSHLKQEVDVFEDELRILCKNNEYKWIKIKAKALFNDQNRAYRMLGFYSDIDKLKKLEEENKEKESFILEQSKISAMGDMLNNIAHQWRQPLSVITSIVSGMKVTMELGMSQKEDIIKDLDIINKTSQNLSKTIDSFKDSYELGDVKETFNLNEALLKSIQTLEPAFNYNNISFVTQTNNIEYFGYKDEFLLVLNKLIQNAKDAIAAKEIKEGFIFICLKEEDNMIRFEIYDNALGIEEEIKDKIFEPYFTTKHKAQGVGLSLYVTKNIVTKYFNGTIKFSNKDFVYENKEYSGASFVMEFPKN